MKCLSNIKEWDLLSLTISRNVEVSPNIDPVDATTHYTVTEIDERFHSHFIVSESTYAFLSGRKTFILEPYAQKKSNQLR